MDPGLLLRGCAPPRKGVTDWRGKQILKAITKKVTSHGEVGGGWVGAHPPPRSATVCGLQLNYGDKHFKPSVTLRLQQVSGIPQLKNLLIANS